MGEGAAAAFLIAFVVTAAAAGFLAYVWLRDRRRAEAAESGQGELEAEKRDLQSQAAMLRKARQAERRWNRELRQKIVELQHARGALGDTSDTAALILRTALSLLEAEKGLLLSRKDEDSDGDLDLLAAEGFEHDPEHSAVAQRFAREVIAQDETLRENDVHADATPSDREIRNLVAIPIYVRDRFSGVVVACNRDGGFDEHDDEVLLSLGDHAGAILQNARLHGALRGAYLATVGVLADAVSFKDTAVRTHSDQVARYVLSVAAELAVEPQQREELLFASLLHDVGKIGVSERILLKPGPLSEEERRSVELHPLIGFSLVNEVPALEPMALWVLHHHERWDGKGYPSGLAGEQIPLEARIIGVADAFSAMTSERPYRGPMTTDEACDELERCSGKQFDPLVVRAFVAEVRRHPPSEPVREREVTLEAALRGDRREPAGFGSYTLVDNLTLLYTRRYLHDIAQSEARRAEDRQRPFAVILVQLSEIDQINREEGYGAGDEAIRSVARTAETAGKRWGATACRYSGRCLALLVTGAGDEVVDRLVEQVAGEIDDGPGVRLSSAVWRPGETGDDVIARARAELERGAAVGS